METAASPSPHGEPRWRHSLSFRLFWLTILAILFVEALVFLPSAGNYRSAWLDERAQAARVATLAVEAARDRNVSRELSAALLMEAEVLAVSEIDDGMRYQILPAQTKISQPVIAVDLREESWTMSMVSAMASFFAPDGRTLLIIDEGAREGRVIEVLVPEAPLKADLGEFGLRILGLSLIISLSAGTLVFVLLYCLVVRPMKRVTRSVEQFRSDPGAWTRRLPPTTRRDEIGRAQNALADMETAVSESFRQRERLAELGEAVARINHDLRGSLAAAQLVSDGLTRSDDPRVQRAAPRLERALQRAINMATQTLQYGKARAPAPDLQPCALSAILDEAAEEAVGARSGLAWRNCVEPGLRVRADPDHLHRIAANLIRNAADAMEDGGEIAVRLEGETLLFRDTGPGLPEAVREGLFKPFAASGKRGGTGLGLAIARDLARAMGGDLDLRQTDEGGSVFALKLPEGPQPAELAAQ